jgi:hypothetical protein
LAPIEEAGDPTRDIACLLTTLPDKQRVATELVKLKELSNAKASNQTGWSASDIKISIRRGLKALMRLVCCNCAISGALLCSARRIMRFIRLRWRQSEKAQACDL